MRLSIELGEETAELRKFADHVWPPQRSAPQDDSVARLTWDTSYSQRILTRNDSGEILSQVALIFRHARWNGMTLRVGGIAGVGTNPAFRGRGLATAGMKRAAEILVAGSFDIGALFCAPEMAPFYERLGWRSFKDAVFIKQPGNDDFPWRGCMTLSVKSNVSGGVLNIASLPW
jgi:GNAT superfamily N-acetyltransferase